MSLGLGFGVRRGGVICTSVRIRTGTMVQSSVLVVRVQAYTRSSSGWVGVQKCPRRASRGAEIG